jgi:predicted Rossmann fold nucleotide-binding protein DprA/Smf involved in DNA uptake
MGFKKRSKSQLALSLLDTQAGQELVQERLTDIDRELVEIERNRKALETERAQLSPLVRGGRKRRTKNGASRGSRSISTDRVLEALSALDGEEPPTKADIAQQLGANPKRLKKPLDTLIEDGSVERVGRGRGTRYRTL